MNWFLNYVSQAVHQQLTTHSKPVASFAFNAITGDFYWSSPEFGVIGRKNVKSRGSEVSWEIRFALY